MTPLAAPHAGPPDRLAEYGDPRLWSAGDPRLAETPQLEPARAVLEAFRPPDDHQRGEQERILAFLDQHPDALHRSCLAGHLTAAAVLLDAERERILLTHHRKLERWLQLGGHCDGDGNLAASALREGIEESGIPDLQIDPRPLDLDVHPIPARPARPGRPEEPAHLHLDVRFLVYAPPQARFVVSEESHDLAWVAPADLARYASDRSVTRLFERVFALGR